MIEPWQVWYADLDDTAAEFTAVVVVSSAFHLRVGVGRLCIIAPLSPIDRQLPFHIRVTPPDKDQPWYVMADQPHTISTTRLVPFPDQWILTPNEINNVRYALRTMLDIR